MRGILSLGTDIRAAVPALGGRSGGIHSCVCARSGVAPNGLSVRVVGLTAKEAAAIIGCSRNHVYRLVNQGRLPTVSPQKWAQLDPAEVERFSLARLPSRVRAHHYWASTTEAAAILGVSRERVHQLVAAERIPAVRHHDTWLFRRNQLEVVANAREARHY